MAYKEDIVIDDWSDECMSAQLVWRKVDNTYELCEKFRSDKITYYNLLHATKNKETLRDMCKKAHDFMDIKNRFESKGGYEEKISGDKDVNFVFYHGANNYLVNMKDNNNKTCGYKHGDLCSFMTYVTLGQMVIHGSSLVQLPYRHKGYGRKMYDILDEKSQFAMVPHGYPLMLNLTDEGRNFWKKRNEIQPVLPYNKQYFNEFKAIIRHNELLTKGTIEDFSMDNYENNIMPLVQFVSIAQSEKRDIAIMMNQDGETIITSYPEYVIPDNVVSYHTVTPQEWVQSLKSEEPGFTDYWNETLIDFQHSKFVRDLKIDTSSWDNVMLPSEELAMSGCLMS